MTATTSGSGPRSRARVDAIEARRQRFADYVDRMMAGPPEGTTWHPLYRWPSDTDEDYRQRVTEHERTQQKTSGRPAGESEAR